MQKTWKMTETLANGYSYESTQWELFNEYHHDMVSMVFQKIWVFVLWMKVALALEGLSFASWVYVCGLNLSPYSCMSCSLCWSGVMPLVHLLHGAVFLPPDRGPQGRSLPLDWRPCGLRRRHWLYAVSHHCLGSNPGLGMRESCQWLGVRRWFFAGYSGFLHYLQLASHELATIGINVTKKRNSNSNSTSRHHLVNLSSCIIFEMLWCL